MGLLNDHITQARWGTVLNTKEYQDLFVYTGQEDYVFASRPKDNFAILVIRNVKIWFVLH